jgi:hypothetical protein
LSLVRRSSCAEFSLIWGGTRGGEDDVLLLCDDMVAMAIDSSSSRRRPPVKRGYDRVRKPRPQSQRVVLWRSLWQLLTGFQSEIF